MAKRKAAKRELINTGTETRYVRRGARGQFKEADDVGRAQAQDRRRRAKTKGAEGARRPRRSLIAAARATVGRAAAERAGALLQRVSANCRRRSAATVNPGSGSHTATSSGSARSRSDCTVSAGSSSRQSPTAAVG
jgi:hypothetical protein